MINHRKLEKGLEPVIREEKKKDGRRRDDRRKGRRRDDRRRNDRRNFKRDDRDAMPKAANKRAFVQ